ncbi:MAG: hypothetical protein QOE55_4786 [Acidobacteriaceae bacterium]|jgi:hypothetical protein|nr:hypothetical protein [Acidobacteriaceae bacterium]
MGSLALRPGNSLAILVDGFVNRLQDVQFPSFLLFKLRGLDSYPGGTFTHCSCQPSLDAHLWVLIRVGERIGDLSPMQMPHELASQHER